MIFKPFDESLKTEFDVKAREVAKLHFSSLGYIVEDHPDKYEVDLVLRDQNNKLLGYLELETRPTWVATVFPFSNINIPKRKEKLLRNLENIPVGYILFNGNYSCGYYLHASDILNSPVKMLKNRYLSEDEYFYVVDLDKAKFFNVSF